MKFQSVPKDKTQGINNMYDKYLETDKKAKLQHTEGLKKAASERLAKNAAWKKANKKSSKE